MKLMNCNKENLYRGTVLNFKYEYRSTYTKKNHTLMICEHIPIGDEAPFALYYIKGYYAGVQKFVFPKEAKVQGAQAISRTWLIENWNTYISDCPVDKVYVYDET